MRKRLWGRSASMIFLLFFLTAAYFSLIIKDHTYLGIRAKLVGDEWIIKKIQPGGAADRKDLKKGDVILTIDREKPEENATLTKWLIVEGISELETARDSMRSSHTFDRHDNVFNKQLIFTFIALICLSVLFILPTFLRSSITYRLFSLFVITLSFLLISVVPSSIGIDLARVLIVLVGALFPFLFLKFSDYGKGYLRRVAKITKIMGFISVINIICLVLNLLGLSNYWLAEYLSIGIFYVFGLFLVILVVSNLLLSKDLSENVTLSQVDLPLITILSFVPLFFFYLFPTQGNAPFYLVVLFILLPLSAITHLLLINRLIKSKRKMKSKVLHTLLAMTAGVVVTLLIELGKYVSTVYLALFTIALVYALLPLLSESLSLIDRKKVGSEGIRLFVAVEEERENISAYIHDTIIQEVIFEMNRLEQEDSAEAKKVKSIFDEIIYGLRELCTEIYPLMIQEIGIEQTLKTTINSIQQKYPVTIKMTLDPRLEMLSLKVKNFLLRTIRETITNSIKHGKATTIEIEVAYSDEKFLLTVFDDGELGSPAEPEENHFGVHLINEKIKMIGGSSSLFKENEQTKFQLVLPCKINEDGEGSLS